MALSGVRQECRRRASEGRGLPESQQRVAKRAPLLMLSVAKRTYSRRDRRNRMAMRDAGMAGLSVVLQAVSMGPIAH